MRRIYQSFSQAMPGMILNLSEDAHHHLFTVLRSREGEELTVFNGLGESWRARITQLAKKHGQIELIEKCNTVTESPLKIHLGQAVSKGDRMDFVMQKATELGVTEITPIITERGNVKLDAERWEKKRTHWNQIIISACEQSGRDTLPILNPVIDLATWFTALKPGLRFILSPHATDSLESLNKPQEVTLLIGPEGGLSEREVNLAVSRCDFKAIQLGPRVLRTETAAITSLSIFQYLWGDFC
jgi:16S rRNA (uracil1498-N3)-methyltransferase